MKPSPLFFVSCLLMLGALDAFAQELPLTPLIGADPVALDFGAVAVGDCAPRQLSPSCPTGMPRSPWAEIDRRAWLIAV